MPWNTKNTHKAYDAWTDFEMGFRFYCTEKTENDSDAQRLYYSICLGQILVLAIHSSANKQNQ